MNSPAPEPASPAPVQLPGSGAVDNRASSIWLALGLVIEQPTHGYELSRRYQHRFGAFVPVNLPRLYRALDRLHETGMIEPMPLSGKKSTPKQHRMRRSFRATDAGVEAYRGWVAERIRDDSQHHALLGQIAATGLLGIDGLLDIIDRYQRECIEQLRSLPPDSEQLEAGDASLDELMESLAVDQQRRELGARHEWAVHARQVLAAQKKHADARARAGRDELAVRAGGAA
jgi:DNA-binding PadR family transcriptional regulator